MMLNLEKLPQLPQDKANHHLYGEAAALLGAIVAGHFGEDPRIGAIASALALGVAKEAWDKLTGAGDPSVMDAVATASGALPIIAGMVVA